MSGSLVALGKMADCRNEFEFAEWLVQEGHFGDPEQMGPAEADQAFDQAERMWKAWH